ncbi:MAG TPA: Asp-tRNA(Asn)/Glu-tRNA(Gln) amidotransferase subunit GatA [Spirochaetota bacterium]|jgi:aspartyl-tRNA(Asn)/glutamyl-tRNA(Gln) amidotransferase subunit A|nr:Asp-tRNA(Asn)/Glu-tRNA(Gln) amidotransferase subunit GatA [Spirochaetota bacterium]HOH36394.1 Asp-tRNA(Asn)/Glu-tRNA(Gln) amidotransferase subunit GatA [Spirochaetota bacterium]HPW51245.1 Asp-tRNA(Asn)/Glu-tRNA(Gln) amidotransferase subunit GatA [Spirochaetota bacterium]HPY02972.1 Asp-tRNA(Asn)/Glu-tRNA(Gln) amidotransferase subunit GatA [Spirochaetota bacterium]HQA53192.1 Asp-tRNA(Asn)/Glu-tRNA(Gln) amidotransferase subunit GatA [Spirochaetota bacterium]
MLYNKSMKELSELLDKKEIKSLDIAQELISRTEKIEPEIHSYITFDRENFLEQSKKSDERRASGKSLSKFDGIPVALKDNIAVKDVKLSCGSKILGDFKSPYNATVTEKLAESGFLISGKTNLDEFAMGSTTESSFYGVTKNPHNTEKVPGGSSGGSAAAVSASLVPASLGSDTGGSIRLPASFCGVVGIKPTYGRVSRFGLVAYASSLDQIGTFARSVDDAADLLSVISGYDKKDSTSAEGTIDFSSDKLSGDVKGLRIGLPDEYFNGVSAEISDAVMNAVKELEKKGAVVEKISLKMTEYAVPVYYLIATSEASSNLSRFDGIRYGRRPEGVESLGDLYEKARSEGFGGEVKRRIVLGTYSLSSGYYDAYYLKALKGRTLIINDFKEAYKKCDVIMSPVAATTAFGIGEKMNDPLAMYLSDILTISANLAGVPGISVPVGLDSQRMPIGLQIMGNYFKERDILNAAKAVEGVFGKYEPQI